MNIALVMPKATFLSETMAFMPLGLCYIAARLESFGHRTELFDLNEDELPRDGEYDQLWISATAPQISDVKRIARETAGWKTKRVLGGASVWADPQTFKTIGFDLAVAGECDHPDATRKILELAENPPSDHYAFFPVSKNLDWVLPPVRRWSDRYNAWFSDFYGTHYRATTMFTSRGCGFSCAFCESGRQGVVWDRFVRFESLDIVEQQIREAKEQGYDCLAYYDDVLPIRKDRTLALMKLHNKYNMRWRCFLRTDLVSKNGGYDYLNEMKKGGLVEIFVGVESADNNVKAAIHKGTTIEQDTDVLRWCRALGIRMKASFILGLPSESMDSMKKTRDWILEHRPDRVQVGRLIPFGGTPLHTRREEYDLKYEEQPPDEWFYSGDNGIGTKSFVSTSHLTRDEIDVFWHDLMAELKREGIPS